MQSEIKNIGQFEKTFNRRHFLRLATVATLTLSCHSHNLTTPREYVFYKKRQANSNLLVSVGDSIARGGTDAHPKSPADFIAEAVNATGNRRWEVLKLAEAGATTKEIIIKQLLAEDLQAKIKSKDVLDIDFIIHTGANDIGKSLAGDEEKITKLKEQLSNWDIPALKGTLEDLGEAVTSFKEDFKEFLKTLHALAGQKVRHLIILSPPDFSQAPRINISINRKIYSFSLDNPIAQFMVREGCNELRNGINETLRGFSGFPVFTVPTDEINRSHFVNDQHLTPEGNQLIARNFLSRVVLT